MTRLLFALVASLLLSSSVANADGLIVIHDPPARIPGHFSFAPLEVTYHHVSVSIDAVAATTSVDQEFYNPNPQRLEGIYLFPLPDGATVDKFAMDVDGTVVEAELLSADKARAIYEEIVRKQKDPGLLEYAGRGAFKVRIFPIEPNGKKHLRLQYTQLIKSDNGLSEYVYPLNTEKFSSKLLENVSVRVELNTTAGIKNVYCPSHPVQIKRDSATHAVVGYKDHDARPDTDFKLVWSTDKDPVGINLMSWQTGADDGYFLLMASPGTDADAKKVQPRDVCFVLDTSGSMAGPKLDQAKKALQFCLNSLNAEDRFEIVRFSTDAEGLFNELRDVTPENTAKGMAFIKDLKAAGGTAIRDALGKANSLFSPDAKRPGVIIFLTDGMPTVGETNEDRLVESSGRGNTRVFCFGIGTDVNTHLLDRIAERSNAVSQYVLPAEDIEVKVSDFYAKIKSPVLSGVSIAFGGNVTAAQQYPQDLPDLFKGQTLTVFGRYHGSGPGSVKVAGTLDGERREFTSDVSFAKEDVRHGFIPRLWATRRVGWLLDEIRLHGQSQELKDEIVRLAREHGIVTPYTSYLILEDERRRNVPMARQTLSEMAQDGVASRSAKDTYDSAARDSDKLEKSGTRAVANSTNAGSLKAAAFEQQAQQDYGLDKQKAATVDAASIAPAGGRNANPPTGVGNSAGAQAAGGYRVNRNYSQQTRVVNGRAFYQNGNVWTDGRSQGNQNLEQRTISFNSEPYYDLLKKHPEASAWLSLGDEVDLVLDQTLYSIRNTQPTTQPSR